MYSENSKILNPLKQPLNQNICSQKIDQRFRYTKEPLFCLQVI